VCLAEPANRAGFAVSEDISRDASTGAFGRVFSISSREPAVEIVFFDLSNFGLKVAWVLLSNMEAIEV
jgi:hypothetical protein